MSEDSETWAKVRRGYRQGSVAAGVNQELAQLINSLLARVANIERRLAEIEKKP